MEKIWPTLKELIPKTCKYSAKKNPAGQIQKITLHTDHLGRKLGSEIYLRSYDQNADTFEGFYWLLERADRDDLRETTEDWEFSHFQTKGFKDAVNHHVPHIASLEPRVQRKE